MQKIIIILSGFAAGIISGMGIGGGVLLIPALVVFAGVEHKVAQSVNLFYFIPTAIGALSIYIKNKEIKLKSLVLVFIFGIIGAITGGLIAIRLSSVHLKKLFGIFLLVLAFREICCAKNADKV